MHADSRLTQFFRNRLTGMQVSEYEMFVTSCLGPLKHGLRKGWAAVFSEANEDSGLISQEAMLLTVLSS